MNSKNINFANRIYKEIYELTDNNHKSITIQKIYNWLSTQPEISADYPIEKLADEWLSREVDIYFD